MSEIEVWQAEWCPDSRVVRQRLTELGVDYVARQVPATRDERRQLRTRTGQDGIPAIVFDDGTVVVGATSELLDELDRRFAEPEGAHEHQQAALRNGSTPVGRGGAAVQI